ncbi:10736_t:CDS:2, partial [Gigaspora rosea]
TPNITTLAMISKAITPRTILTTLAQKNDERPKAMMISKTKIMTIQKSYKRQNENSKNNDSKAMKDTKKNNTLKDTIASKGNTEAMTSKGQ